MLSVHFILIDMFTGTGANVRNQRQTATIRRPVRRQRQPRRRRLTLAQQQRQRHRRQRRALETVHRRIENVNVSYLAIPMKFH